MADVIVEMDEIPLVARLTGAAGHRLGEAPGVPVTPRTRADHEDIHHATL
jgi:hypothetical protein